MTFAVCVDSPMQTKSHESTKGNVGTGEGAEAMKLNHLWVIEMLSEVGVWESTLGVRLTRDDGKRELSLWRKLNPDDRFRLVKYERVEKGKS